MMTVKQLMTIGVYGFTADQFFDTLLKAKVDTLCDIRLRRAVRGPQYAFANSNRLQNRLAELGIQYRHFLELAPTHDLLNLQEHADHTKHIARRDRTRLEERYITEYTRLRLDPLDVSDFLKQLESSEIPVLLCVEHSPEACHRGLLAAKIHAETSIPVIHLS